MTDADTIIRAYGLTPHPEGGWYREFHRSGCVLEGLPGYPGPRPACTALWLCLRRGESSAFHRLRSEEAWIHLSGGPVELFLLSPGGSEARTIASVEDGGPPATVIPAGTFQAARPAGGYCLVSCLVAPGFDFGDFELAARDDLLAAHPADAEIIRAFAPP